MFGRGNPNPAAQISAAGLMALEPQAQSDPRDLPSLAERPGSTATRKRGQGHEIREVRPYSEGDDLRHLDAAATARTGAPHIRTFHEDRELSLFLIVDFRKSMLWGTQGKLRSVAAAEALVLAGWRAILAGGAVGVLAMTDAGPEAQAPRPRHRGMAQVAACLARAHDKALAYRGAQRSLDQELAPLLRQVPRGASILFATGLDLPGPGLDAALAGLRARGPLTLLLVEDRFELAPPPQPLPYALGARAQWGRFDALAAAAEARASRLSIAGQRVRRYASSGGNG